MGRLEPIAPGGAKRRAGGAWVAFAGGRRHYLRNYAMTKSRKVGRSASEHDRQVALRRFKAEVFQALAHPTRVHIAECLQDGELPVSVLVERIGIEPANLSQHLGVLRAKGLVVNRKEGAQVFYALRDPLLSDVLRNMRRFFQAHVEEALQILRDL
jgi:DNA-binding transcriptional ArsR family regulator